MLYSHDTVKKPHAFTLVVYVTFIHCMFNDWSHPQPQVYIYQVKLLKLSYPQETDQLNLPLVVISWSGTVPTLIWYGCACSICQGCPTLFDPEDCCLPGSSVHGISQASILEWGAISSSRGSSWPRDGTWVSCISCIGRRILYHWATWEAP